jgi:hypothetical protein
MKELFADLPFYSGVDLSGRLFPLLPYFNHTESRWRIWIFNGRLLEMKGQPVESGYFSNQAVTENDAHLAFMEFWLSRANFASLSHFIKGIETDVINLSALISQIQMISISDGKVFDKSRLTAISIEYALIVTRSIYDLLQEINQKLFKMCRREDGKAFCKDMPDSFAKVVFDGEKVRSHQEISNKYNLPECFGQWYIKASNHFGLLRDWRNKIEHGGHDFNYIFNDNNEMLVKIDEQPFIDIDIWTKDNTRPNNLGSVKSFIAFLLNKIILDLNEHAFLLSSNIQLPPSLTHDVNLFYMGRNSSVLKNINKIISDPFNHSFINPQRNTI